MSTLIQVLEISRGDEAASFQLYGSLFFGGVAKTNPVFKVIESAPQALSIRLDLQSLQSLLNS